MSQEPSPRGTPCRGVLHAWMQGEEDELLYDADLWDAQHAVPVDDTRPCPTWGACQCDLEAALRRQTGEEGA